MARERSLARPRGQKDLLNYRLKTLLALSGAPGLRLFEGGFGIARAEWHLLAILVEDGAMSPSELGRRAQMESARASRPESIDRSARKSPCDRRRRARHPAISFATRTR